MHPENNQRLVIVKSNNDDTYNLVVFKPVPSSSNDAWETNQAFLERNGYKRINSTSNILKRIILASLPVLLASCATPAQAPTPIPSTETTPVVVEEMPETEDPHGFVDVRSLSPNIKVKLAYATSNNFLGRAVYPSGTKCLLRKSAAEKLALVQASLEKQGLGLLVWDCYRPLEVQEQMWKIMPDSKYVANPKKGSKHNRGMAVDLTLVDANGELEMPTKFDDFSDRARSDYQGGTAEQRKNRDKLKEEMQAQGFTSYAGEWWHFDAIGWKSYPVE